MAITKKISTHRKAREIYRFSERYYLILLMPFAFLNLYKCKSFKAIIDKNDRFYKKFHQFQNHPF